VGVEPVIEKESVAEEGLIYVDNLEAATFLKVPLAPSSTKNKSASAIPAPISVSPVNKAVLSLSAVTDVSEGVTVPPTAPDISTIKILAPLAGAVLNVIDAPPLAKV